MGYLKLAMNLEQLAQAAKVVKQHFGAPAWLRRLTPGLTTVPKKLHDRLTETVLQHVMGRPLSSAEIASQKALALQAVAGLPGLMKVIGTQAKFSPVIKKPLVAGDMVGALKSYGMDVSAFSGPEKAQMSRLGWLHEGDEALALAPKNRRKFPWVPLGVGHASPEVLLREHNRLVTSPDLSEKVLQAFRGFRRMELAPVPYSWKGAAKNWEYGVGPRLSRHERGAVSRAYADLSRGAAA